MTEHGTFQALLEIGSDAARPTGMPCLGADRAPDASSEGDIE
jgi:hypothetical protein